jgi:outer membrane autotransporter protein
MGLLGGYLHSGVKPSDESANADIAGTQFGFYGRGAFDNFGLAFLGGYVSDHFNVTRSVILGTDANTLTGTYDGGLIQSALQMDYRLTDVGSTFRPFWGLLYTHLSENAFSETGSDSLALSLPSLSYDSVRAYAGLEETWNFSLGKSTQLSPRLHAAISQELSSLNPTFQTSLNGAPDNPFQIGGIVPDGMDFGVGGGVNLALDQMFNLFADFDGHFSSTGSLSTVSCGMNLDI